MKFLDDFEKLCTSPSEFESIRNHTAYKEFMKKFNLASKTYFQLRQQEISQKFEAALNVNPQIPVTIPPSSGDIGIYKNTEISCRFRSAIHESVVGYASEVLGTKYFVTFFVS